MDASKWAAAIRDIGLPGALALAMLYVLTVQLPELQRESQKLSARVRTLTWTVTNQTHIMSELEGQIVDHRLVQEQGRRPRLNLDMLDPTKGLP